MGQHLDEKMRSSWIPAGRPRRCINRNVVPIVVPLVPAELFIPPQVRNSRGWPDPTYVLEQLKDGLKDLKAEIKGEGFNVKVIDRVVAIRRSKGAADKEAELINDVLLYAHATGTRLNVDLGDGNDGDRNG